MQDLRENPPYITERAIPGQVSYVDWDDSPDPSHILILLHGAITYGDWMDEVRNGNEAVSASPVKVIGMKLGFLSSIWLISRIGTSLLAKLTASRLKIIVSQYPSSKISIASHSFGCMIIRDVVKRNYVDIEFDKLFLLGSILKIHESSCFQNRFSQIYCDTAAKDWFVVLLHSYMPWCCGMSGLIGIDECYGNVTNRRFPGEHSVCVSESHFRTFIMPSIVSGIKRRLDPEPKIEVSRHLKWFFRGPIFICFGIILFMFIN